MRADEVSLPFCTDKKAPDVPQNSGSVSHPPMPISVEELDELLRTENITIVNGMKVVGDLPPDPADVPIRFCCRCERLDLTSERDRNKYANLIASSSTPTTTVEVGWEERVKESDKLVIYITYMEYIRVVENVVPKKTV